MIRIRGKTPGGIDVLNSMEMDSPRTYGADTFSCGTRGCRLEGHEELRTSERMPIRLAAAPLVQDALPAYGSSGIGGSTGTDNVVVDNHQNNIQKSPNFSSFLFSTSTPFQIPTSSNRNDSFVLHSTPPQMRGSRDCTNIGTCLSVDWKSATAFIDTFGRK